MRTNLWLALSLALNVITASAVIFLWSQRGAPQTANPLTPATGSSQSPGSSTDTPRPKGTAADAVSSGSPAHPVDWRRVESADYQQYITNLRAIGCPTETIRDIIIADVNKLFDARRKELRGASTNKFQFWKTGGNPLGDMLNEDRLAKQQELASEKRTLLRTLLGEGYTDKVDLTAAVNPLEDIFDFIPASKQSELIEMEQKFGVRLLNTLKDAQKGNIQSMRQVQQEKDAELAKILSPQEFEEYQLRLSQTATLMRMKMSEFQPTEQEFRDIFKLQKSFDDEYGIMGMQSNNPEDVKKRNAAQKELDAALRTTLGEDRFLDYRYAQNLTSSSLGKIVDEYQVPRASALKVFEIQDVAQEQARQVRLDTTLTAEQRQRSLDALRAATEKEVGNHLGQAALNAYVERGSWLKNLNNPATTTRLTPATKASQQGSQ